MTMADELQKIHELKEAGAISEEEYAEAKQSILRKGQSLGDKLGKAVDGLSEDVRTWSMLIHLSQLCGLIFPIAGYVVPIILWQVKKGDSEIIDKHGRIVANWMISELIYAAVSGILVIIVIGIPMLIAVVIAGIVFPIIGGVKAKEGLIWRYPLSIRFFSVDIDDYSSLR